MLNNWHAPKQRHPEELFPINEIKYSVHRVSTKELCGMKVQLI